MKQPLLPFEKIKWIHQITFPDGRITPGKWGAYFQQYGLTDISFKNKRVLDIGCLDGVYSFFAEKKGAKEVMSIDINEEQFGEQKFSGTNWSAGYLYAHAALKSKAKYIFPYSVYDLDPMKVGSFDVVLYLGVHYHLAHPLLALERINEVMKMDGVMLFESEMSSTFSRFYHKMQLRKKTKKTDQPVAIRIQNMPNYLSTAFKLTLLKPVDFIHALNAQFRMVIWMLVSPFISDTASIHKHDVSNFWVMDAQTLERHLDFAGFSIEKKIHNFLSSRVTYICKKKKEVSANTYAYTKTYTNYKKRITNFK